MTYDSNNPQRLFDCIEHQLQVKPLEVMLSGKISVGTPIWKKFSTQQVSDLVNDLAAGLLSLGISANDKTPEGRDKIAIISKNRPEWLITDLAVQKIGAVLTPIYPTINLNELEFILTDAKVKLVFVNDEDLYQKVQSLKQKLPWLINIYSFEKVEGCSPWTDVTSKFFPDRCPNTDLTRQHNF